ncbi:MAG TPA: 50S ribosomal protein L20 [bacterium]|nr:50S ribosomal protein L20 [bacterium]HOL47313.1 50S ribosomal protein L20 [bacterium]HPQ17650.1 50S ribosomal protein L20 [bacterium]
MVRVKKSTGRNRKKKKVFKLTKGYWGRRKNLWRNAVETLKRALAYSYRDRKVKKRNFRRLWITRINAGLKQLGLSYSKFINGLRKLNIALNRKMLADIAVNDFDTFKAIVEKVKVKLAEA